MRALLDRWVVGIGLALASTAAFAVELEEAQTLVGKAGLYMLVLVTIVAGFCVYFMPPRDRREAPLRSALNETAATHWVEGDVLVVQCARNLIDRKIGALMVMEGEKLVGVFTERDAVSPGRRLWHQPRVEPEREVQELA